jgi:RNA polymerase sigma-70 factor (ECF subfamily)
MANLEQGFIEKIYREESGRILATLIRLLGDFDLAEEAAQEAFAVALEQWPRQGIPGNPRAWLVSTARNKAVDLLRRRSRFEKKQEELQRLAGEQPAITVKNEPSAGEPDDAMLSDDRLRLIFTCCHPALRTEAQVALTLRTLCGLSTEEIAKAFLAPVPTMAQRLVRARGKIRDARIPYRVPPMEELAERLAAVMLVVYLVFNEGYNAASGDALVRRELCAEAIRLGRVLCELLPQEAEARGLLALMLLHDSRRDTRTGSNGEMLLLEEQDRSRWNQEQIREGLALVESALRNAPPGAYSVQAAIAAVHARAERAEATDWAQIAGLYDVLIRLQPSSVVELNRAVAVAMAQGPAEGLRLLGALEAKGELRGYYLLPAAKGDLARRLERWSAAAESYRQALALVTNETERRFLSRRLAEAESKGQ